MSRRTTTERLRDAGLFIEFEDPDYIMQRMTHFIDGKGVYFIRYCTIHNASPVFRETNVPIRYENTIQEPPLSVALVFAERTWHVYKIEGHGGFAESDFTCAYAHFAEVEQTAITYYFGSPTIIQGWSVPLHKHPELDKAKVEGAIRTAPLVSTQEFEHIKTQLLETRDKEPPVDDWEDALKRHFIFIPHQDTLQHICALRRNAEHAYIIPKIICTQL